MNALTIATIAAAAALASALGPNEVEVCAFIGDACGVQVLCAPVVANGACTALPVPDTLQAMISAKALYTTAAPVAGSTTEVQATLFSDEACTTPLAQSFKLGLGVCTPIPDFPFSVKATGSLTGAPAAAPPGAAAPTSGAAAPPAAAVTEAGAGEAAAGATTVAATTTFAATTQAATTMAAGTTAADTAAAPATTGAAETAPAETTAAPKTRRGAKLDTAAAASVAPTAFALLAAVCAVLLN